MSSIQLVADEAQEYLQWFRERPTIFAKEVLGVDFWSKQKEIANSVKDNARTTVRSCSAAGKTTVAACLVLWFLTCFYPSTVLTTGRSFRQVKDQLWREIRARHARSRPPIGGDITQTSLTLSDKEKWFAEGFTTDEPERMTGFHNKYVLVVVDEASGIPDEVYNSLENPLASGFTRYLLLGNPTQNIGRFKDSFTSPNYKSIHISAYDTPSFIGEGNYPFLINKDYIEQKKLEWGEDSPLYEVYIKGDFPSGETDRLIPFGLAEAATFREIIPGTEEGISIGVDTARMGEDENALYVRKGEKVIDSHFWRKAKTEEIIGRISHEIKEHESQITNIDEGYNPGVVDGLKALQELKQYKINGISFQQTAKDSKVFANARAEMYWELAQRFKVGDIQIPNDKILLKQLTDIKKKPLNRYDQIILESKQDMKQRGLKSPDRGDALALCFYELPQSDKNPVWFIETD